MTAYHGYEIFPTTASGSSTNVTTKTTVFVTDKDGVVWYIPTFYECGCVARHCQWEPCQNHKPNEIRIF